MTNQSQEIEHFKEAILKDDLAAVRQSLGNRRVRALLDSPLFPFGRPPLLETRSVEAAELLIDAGADLRRVSQFARPGFWLDEVPADVARFLAEKGAGFSIHAAAALGLVTLVREMLDRKAALVNSKGGDGGTPLHFARTVEIARLLLEQGAEIDALDEDHRSTPSQWRIKSSPDVTRFLLRNGARPDLFLAAALGDWELAQKALASDPESVTYRIGDNSCPYPGIGFEGRGGTILQWQLGFNQAPQEIAFKRGHEKVYRLLMESTPPLKKLQIACMLADRDLARSLLARFPTLVEEFTDEDKTLLAKVCWETNNETEAIRLMLECGFPVGIPEPNHGYSPLHNAAWCGNAEVVRLLLDYGHPVDLIDPQYNSSAAGYAIHSATEARRYENVDYGGVIDALIKAGWKKCLEAYPVGHEDIDAVLKKHL